MKQRYLSSILCLLLDVVMSSSSSSSSSGNGMSQGAGMTEESSSIPASRAEQGSRAGLGSSHITQVSDIARKTPVWEKLCKSLTDSDLTENELQHSRVSGASLLTSASFNQVQPVRQTGKKRSRSAAGLDGNANKGPLPKQSRQ